MKTWINVLAVDDNEEYYSYEAGAAEKHGITLIHCHYWNTALEWIRESPFSYDVIILDGKGQIGPETDTADINHLKKAIQDLNVLKGQGIAIPFVVNTGFSDESAIGYGIRVFTKGSQEDQLYRYVKELANDSPSFRMRSSYPDIILLFEDTKMGKPAEAHFLELFQIMEPKRFSSPDPRNTIRKLLEAFCKEAARIGIIDDRLAPKSGKVNLTSCGIFINGHEVWYPNKENPTHQIQTSQGIFEDAITSSFHYILRNTQSGSHFNEGGQCSPHLAKALFHALAVLLSWLQKFATDHPDPAENRKTIQIEKTT